MTVDPADPRLDALRITMSDVRRAGHCAKGTRDWFQTYGLDFRDFLKHGIPARAMLATGDGYGEQVVAQTLGRLTDG